MKSFVLICTILAFTSVKSLPIEDLKQSATHSNLFDLGSLFGRGGGTNLFNKFGTSGGYPINNGVYYPNNGYGNSGYPQTGIGGYGGVGTNQIGGGYNGYNPYGTGYGSGYNTGYGGYGGYGGNGGLSSYYGYNTDDYYGNRNLGYGYYRGTNVYGLPRTNYYKSNPYTGYRGYY